MLLRAALFDLLLELGEHFPEVLRHLRVTRQHQ